MRSPARCRHWTVYFNDGRPPLDLIFDPEALDGVQRLYPGRIEPAPEPADRTATPAEADELRRLIDLVLADGTDEDRAEALATASADVHDALTSYRALAAIQNPERAS